MQQSMPQLEYPVKWRFRVIVESAATGCAETLREKLRSFGRPDQLEEGLKSGGGKYRTYLFECTLNSREEMEKLSGALSKVPGVKLVI